MTDSNLDDLSRRRFMASVAKSCLGVSVMPMIGSMASAASMPPAAGKAKHLIYLFMQGAMSHLDTFDTKPGAETQGETESISTAVSGVQFGNGLPGLAQRANQLAVIRSMTTETGAHEQGQYLMRTSYKAIGSIRHPFLGAWLHKVEGKLNRDLPGSVLVGGANRHPGAGYLSAEFSPAPVGSAATGLQNTKSPGYIKDNQLEKRLRLTKKFERNFWKKYKHREVHAYLDYYNEAVKLLKSKDLVAFDIKKEKAEVRKNYGENKIGQGCLLARRLIQKGVRCVEVAYGSWDHHRDVFTTLPERCAELDQAVSALLDDLTASGKIKDTMIVIGTEFGRTPKINQNVGRDHHPGAFSCVLAGGSVKGGTVYGETDKTGASVETDGVYPADLNATIAYGLGLPVSKEFKSDTGRPFKIADDGKPIKELFT